MTQEREHQQPQPITEPTRLNAITELAELIRWLEADQDRRCIMRVSPATASLVVELFEQFDQIGCQQVRHISLRSLVQARMNLVQHEVNRMVANWDAAKAKAKADWEASLQDAQARQMERNQQAIDQARDAMRGQARKEGGE